MKTASTKAKGRNLQKWAAKKISELTGIPYGKDELIASRPMGQPGTDIVLKGEARKKFPFSVECKNQERWDIHSWIRQAQCNQLDKTDWLIICKKNRMHPVVIIDAECFFNILKKEKND